LGGALRSCSPPSYMRQSALSALGFPSAMLPVFRVSGPSGLAFCASRASQSLLCCPRCIGLSFAELACPDGCQLSRPINTNCRDAAAVLRASRLWQALITRRGIQYNTSHVRSSFGGLYHRSFSSAFRILRRCRFPTKGAQFRVPKVSRFSLPALCFPVL